jgi:hypothetical protein
MSRVKPKIFVQDIPPYKTQVLVCAGGTLDDVLSYLKANKGEKEMTSWVKKEGPDIFKMMERNEGLVCWSEELALAIMLLKPYQDTWTYWETLIHEVHHVVHRTAKDRGMIDEWEAQAYLQEFLFRAIRKELQ